MTSLSTEAVEAIAKDVSEVAVHPDPATRIRELAPLWINLFDLLSRLTLTDEIDHNQRRAVIERICIPLWQRKLAEVLPNDIHSAVEAILCALLRNDSAHEGLVAIFEVASSTALAVMGKESENEDAQSVGKQGSDMERGLRPLMSMLKRKELWAALKESEKVKEIEETIKSRAVAVILEKTIRGRTKLGQKLLKLIFTNDAVDSDIDTIWKMLTSSSSASIEGRVTILTAVADRLFKGELWKNNFFFETLQHGLSDEDNFVRKRSLYLLKRGVDRAQELDFSSELLRDARGNKQTWDSFFLVIECSAEKQVHIVKQVTGRLAELARSCGAGTTDYLIHYTWVLVLYRALFKHQNQAIAKWSACYFLETFTCTRGISAVEDEMIKMVTGDLLSALNNPKIFQKGEGPHRENLLRFLIAWTDVLEHKDAQKFWNSFLTSTLTWTIDIIPLFFIWEASYEATKNRASGDLLTAETLVRIAEFVERGMRNQYPLLKGGAQAIMLKLVMKTTTANVFQDGPGSVLKFLAAFHRQNSVLVHGTDLWTAVSHWASGSSQAPLEADVSLEALKENALASIMKTDIGSYVATAVRDIASSANRPYDVAARVKMLELEFVLEIIDGPRRRRGRDGFLFYGFDSPSSGKSGELLEAEANEHFLTSVVERVKSVPQISDLPENERLVNLAFRCKRQSGAVESLVLRSIDRIVNRGRESSDGVTDGAHLFAMTVIEQACGHPTYKRHVLEDSRIKSLLMNAQLPDEKWARLETSMDETSCILDEADRRLRVVHIGQNIKEQWCIVRTVYPTLNRHEKMQAMKFLVQEAIKSASSGGADGIEAMQECMALVLENSNSENANDDESLLDGVAALLKECRASVFDFRKNDKFFPLLSAFVKLAFGDQMLERTDCPITEGHFSFLMEQAELVPGIAAILAERLSGFVADSNRPTPPLLFRAAITFLLFGSLHKKEHKLTEDANRCVLDYGPDLPVNSVEGSDHIVEAVVRAHGLKILLLVGRRGGGSELLAAAREADSMLPSNRRQYENSTNHLVRHRLWQALLVLTEFCAGDDDGAAQLLDLALGMLVEKCVQPSVRHLSEWIAVRVVRKNRSLLERLHASYDAAKRDRPGSIPSYLFVLTQIFVQSGVTDDLEVGMRTVAPFLMAQTFAVRTAALVSFRKLYEMAGDRPDLREKFSAVSDCVEECARQGDPGKNQAKLDELPFLTTLDPVKNFSMRDIFLHYSRIMGLVPSEWENFVAFERVLSENELTDSLGRRHDDGPDLSSVVKHRGSSSSSIWLDMAAGVQDASAEDSAIQKKVMPWMEMLEAEEDAVAAEGRRCAFPHLTLVATLVDRLPNLGGLCRTCEILGVGRYVIGSRRFAEEGDFTNTSVTAEKWVPMEEVPARAVAAFLEERRREGCAIVGVEQTSESVPLQEFEFPRKTVLLLGNERAGIPVELIGLVDHCVEIPQRGMIRSFNVHVTGALVLWEYVKQHTPKSESRIISKSSCDMPSPLIEK